MSKTWKFALWWASFVQSIWRFRWKSIEELCLMTLKSDAKFQGKPSLGSKNDMSNLVIFNASSGKSENTYILLLSIANKVSAKNVHNNYLSRHSLKTLAIWWIIARTVESLKICTLMGCFRRKYIMFEIKNTGELCREKRLMFSKMT